MLIPLINPCGTRRFKRRKNPIVFKPGQEKIMEAFKRYAKRQITHGSAKMRKRTKSSLRFSSGPLYSTTGRLISNPSRGHYSSVYPYIHYYKDEWGKRMEAKRKKKRPATRRGSHSQQEGSMVYSLKRRPRRHSRRRARRNPSILDRLQHPRFSRGKRKASRRRSRRIRLGAHRPVIIRTAHAWRRPKRSKLFRRATRINPRRRSHRRYRRNPLSLPKLPFNIQNVAMGGLKIAGGIAIGMLGMPLIVKHVAPMVDKTGQYRKFYGLFHIVLGAVAAATIRKQIVKDMALTVAGVGVYDLISQNIPQLKLPKIGEAMGDEPGVIGMEADMEPAMMGSSYQTVLGASYGSDDIAYGSDNDSLDC